MALGIAFQLSDDIMDFISTEEELHKHPGQDMKLGVYTLPVLFALQEGDRSTELAALLAQGPPEGERLTQALEIVREEGSMRLAREAVHGRRPQGRPPRCWLEPGKARDALVHIAEFIAERCGADV